RLLPIGLLIRVSALLPQMPKVRVQVGLWVLPWRRDRPHELMREEPSSFAGVGHLTWQILMVLVVELETLRMNERPWRKVISRVLVPHNPALLGPPCLFRLTEAFSDRGQTQYG